MYQSKAGTEAILLMDHRFKREHILYPCIVILVYTTSLCISYIYVSCFKTFVLLLLILFFFFFNTGKNIKKIHSFITFCVFFGDVILV